MLNKHGDKMIFHNEIAIRPLPDGKSWEMKDWIALEFKSGVIFVPTGFVLDLTSIPRFFWRIIGPPATGKYRRGALFHDWLYATQTLERDECDKIFNDIMIFDGVRPTKRRLIYYTVRVFGAFAWKHKRKDSAKIRNLLVKQRRVLNEIHVNFDRLIYA